VRKLTVFNHVTLDGYFVGANGDFSWAHSGTDDVEYSAFVEENAKGGGQLLFGRITYELMASYWPTAIAGQHDPIVAERMNNMPKVVFSRTLDQASWNNTRLITSDIVPVTRKLKDEPGPGMAIFGSGSVVSHLAAAGLIDEYQMVVDPVVLGTGRTMFEGVQERLILTLVGTRTFKNGKVLLSYEPAR